MPYQENGVTQGSLGLYALGDESANIKYFFVAGDKRFPNTCADAIARRINGGLLRSNAGIGHVTSFSTVDTKSPDFHLIRMLMSDNRGRITWIDSIGVIQQMSRLEKGLLVCGLDMCLSQVVETGARLAEKAPMVYLAVGRLSGVDHKNPIVLPQNVKIYSNLVQFTDGQYLH